LNNSIILASCSSDKTIKIWSENPDSKEWCCIATLDDGHSKTIRHLAWSPQGNLLASASFDGSTVIWRREQENNTMDFTCI
jgi:WD40 repeat protein